MEIIKQSEVPIWSVTSYGEVISNKTNKQLKPYKRRGYLSVKYKDKHYTIHRLVAKAFIGDIPERFCVNHIDGNKENNCIDNLEIVSSKENLKHALDTNLRKPLRGSRRPNAKLSEEDAENLIKEIVSGFSTGFLSEKYGFSKQYIRNIKNKQKWKHIWARY